MLIISENYNDDTLSFPYTWGETMEPGQKFL